jgi:hypothetical protein
MPGVPTSKQKISPGLRSPCNLTFWMTLVSTKIMVRPSVNTIKGLLRSNIQSAYDVLYDSTDCLYPTIQLADYRFYIFYYLYYRILQYHMVLLQFNKGSVFRTYSNVIISLFYFYIIYFYR